jgi:hypothetical protein
VTICGIATTCSLRTNKNPFELQLVICVPGNGTLFAHLITSGDLLRTEKIFARLLSFGIMALSIKKLKMLMQKTVYFSDVLWAELNKKVVQNCSKGRIYSPFHV